MADQQALLLRKLAEGANPQDVAAQMSAMQTKTFEAVSDDENFQAFNAAMAAPGRVTVQPTPNVAETFAPSGATPNQLAGASVPAHATRCGHVFYGRAISTADPTPLNVK